MIADCSTRSEIATCRGGGLSSQLVGPPLPVCGSIRSRSTYELEKGSVLCFAKAFFFIFLLDYSSTFVCM
jgi:hypothetical protein